MDNLPSDPFTSTPRGAFLLRENRAHTLLAVAHIRARWAGESNYTVVTPVAKLRRVA